MSFPKQTNKVLKLLLACLFTALPIQQVWAAYIAHSNLSGVNNSATSLPAEIIGSTFVVSQAIQPASPGIVVINNSEQVAFVASDGTATSKIDIQFIAITGEPVLLGIPGEIGELTFTGNTLPTLNTLRSYTRPVIFTQLIDDDFTPGVSVNTTAPFREGNTFTFQVDWATGMSGNLNGKTLRYFVAEEGWHKLIDGRTLLVSTQSFRSEGYSYTDDSTFDLGGQFSQAAFVAQTQSPALSFDSDWINSTDITGYHTVGMLADAAASALPVKYFEDATTVTAVTNPRIGAHIGFMALGNTTGENLWSINMQSDAVGWTVIQQPVEKFANAINDTAHHGAATSPLLNQVACADDDGLDFRCLYFSPPLNALTQSSDFMIPRLPHMKADYTPLTLNLNFHGHYEAFWDATGGEWESDAVTQLSTPDYQYPCLTGTCTGSVTGLYETMFPKYTADDFYTIWDQFWTHNNLWAVPTCSDNLIAPCTDVAANTVLESNNAEWWTTSIIVESNNGGVTKARDAIYNSVDFLDTLTPEQAVLSTFDGRLYYGGSQVDVINPDVESSQRLVSHLGLSIPEDVQWNVCIAYANSRTTTRTIDSLRTNMLTHINTVNTKTPLQPWQTLGTKFISMGADIVNADSITKFTNHYALAVLIPYSENQGWQISSTYTFSPWLSGCYEFDAIATPVLGTLTDEESVETGTKLFVNFPFQGTEQSSFEWRRVDDLSGTNPVTLSTNWAGYIATVADEEHYIQFCMDTELTGSSQTTCSNYIYVNSKPVAKGVITAPAYYAIMGTELTGSYEYYDPNGNAENNSDYYWATKADANASWYVEPSSQTFSFMPTGISQGGYAKFCVTPKSTVVDGLTRCSRPVYLDTDFDGDGNGDNNDPDDDKDGVRDWQDAFPYDDSESADNDGDGIGDIADTDDDNDGVSDDNEILAGTDPYSADSDGDGLTDDVDPYPNWVGDWSDNDSDTIHDSFDDDDDNDGVNDDVDGKPYEACLSSSITVSNGNDSGVGSLRQALNDICPNGTISFDAAYTIHLSSPLEPYSGVFIDGARQVQLNGDADSDGVADNQIFIIDLDEKLPVGQSIILSALDLRLAKAETDQGSAITILDDSFVFIEATLITENIDGPVILSAAGRVYIDNSIIANNSGSGAAILQYSGFTSAFSTTFYNNEGGAIWVDPHGRAQLKNSLLLSGDSSATLCDATLEFTQNSWVEDGTCSGLSNGSVSLADPSVEDYRPIPGSATIDAGVEDEGMMFDYAGNTRIENALVDIGALEYDPSITDFDGDTFLDGSDNCISVSNPLQIDSDSDGAGNVCDSDDDNDGVSDTSDAFPLDNTESVDSDDDGMGNNADTDDDNDGIADGADSCPAGAIGWASNGATDNDGDGCQDSDEDKDDDNDGLTDEWEIDNNLDPLDGICPSWVCGGLNSWRHVIRGQKSK